MKKFKTIILLIIVTILATNTTVKAEDITYSTSNDCKSAIQSYNVNYSATDFMTNTTRTCIKVTCDSSLKKWTSSSSLSTGQVLATGSCSNGNGNPLVSRTFGLEKYNTACDTATDTTTYFTHVQRDYDCTKTSSGTEYKIGDGIIVDFDSLTDGDTIALGTNSKVRIYKTGGSNPTFQDYNNILTITDDSDVTYMNLTANEFGMTNTRICFDTNCKNIKFDLDAENYFDKVISQIETECTYKYVTKDGVTTVVNSCPSIDSILPNRFQSTIVDYLNGNSIVYKISYSYYDGSTYVTYKEQEITRTNSFTGNNISVNLYCNYVGCQGTSLYIYGNSNGTVTQLPFTNYYAISSDPNILKVDTRTGAITATSAGDVTIWIINRTTGELVVTNKTIYETNTDYENANNYKKDNDTFINFLKGLENTTVTAKMIQDTTAYSIGLQNYIQDYKTNKKIAGPMESNITCDSEGTCSFDIIEPKYDSTTGAFLGNETLATVSNVKVEFKGLIYSTGSENIVYSVEYLNNYNFVNYLKTSLDSSATYTYEYDSNYLVQNADGSFNAIKSGNTTIKITGTDGTNTYTTTVKLLISPSSSDINEITTYLKAYETNGIDVLITEEEREEYSSDFKDYVSNIVTSKEPNTSFDNYLTIKIYELENDYVLISATTSTITPGLNVKVRAKVNYSSTSNAIFSQKHLITQNLTTLDLVSVEDTYDIYESCGITGTSCIEEKLKTILLKNTDYTGSVTITDMNTIFGNKILSNVTINYTVAKDDNLVFKATKLVSFDSFIPYDSTTELTDTAYIDKYFREHMNRTTTVTQVLDETYKIVYNNTTCYFYLNKLSDIKATSISFKESVMSVASGDTIETSLYYYPDYANVLPTITYTSNDESIATVDSDGKITGVSKGVTTIKAYFNKYSYTTMTILVDETYTEYLDEFMKYIPDSVVIEDYQIFRNGLAGTIQNAIYTEIYKNNGNIRFPLLKVEETTDGKIIAYTQSYLSGSEYRSTTNKEITYTIQGIIADTYEYELTTGDVQDINLRFTEGDAGNLLYSVSNEDIISFDNGKITAKKLGGAELYLYDKYNRYWACVKVYVDKEAMIDDLHNKISALGTVKVDISAYDSSTIQSWSSPYNLQSIVENSIGYSLYDSGYTCSSSISSTAVRYTPDCNLSNSNHIDIEYSTYGFKALASKFEVNTGNTYDITTMYTYTDEDGNSGNVSYSSMSTDTCTVDSAGKVSPVSPGLCVIKATAGSSMTYILGIVDKSTYETSIKNKIDALSSNITVPMEKYDTDLETDTNNYSDIYYTLLQNRLLGNQSVEEEFMDNTYLSTDFQLDDINGNYLTVGFTARFDFEDKDNLIYRSIDLDAFSYSKTYTLTYSTISSEDQILGEKIINKITEERTNPYSSEIPIEYNLTLDQALKYVMAGRKGDMYKYSSIKDDISSVCSDCTYEYSARLGDGDAGYDMNGGFVYLLKDNKLIGTLEAKFIAEFDVEIEGEISSETELLSKIEDSVVTAYDNLTKSQTQNFNMFKNVNRESTTNCVVTRKFDADEGTFIYDIKLDSYEFGAKINTIFTDAEEYTYDVTSITLSKTDLKIRIGSTETITATISPINATNKTLTWASSNTEIATVENGLITAIKEGTATITATSNNGVVATLTVTVRPLQDLTDIVTSGGFRIDNGVAHGFVVGTSIDSLKSNVFNDLLITPTGKSVGKIATGTKLTYDGETIDVVIYGDLTGDGLINSADLLAMRKHLIGTSKLSGAYLQAAKVVNKSTINSADLLRLRRHLLKTNPIEQ